MGMKIFQRPMFEFPGEWVTSDNRCAGIAASFSVVSKRADHAEKEREREFRSFPLPSMEEVILAILWEVSFPRLVFHGGDADDSGFESSLIRVYRLVSKSIPFLH